MKRWVICISYVLTIFMMVDFRAFADEVKSLASAKQHVQKEPSMQNKSPEDCMPISMGELVERLKASKAIGFFTKLAIRSDVLDFQDEVIKMRKNKVLEVQMLKVKASFDGLLLKIMALLEEDPDLAKEIYSARHSIFQSLLEVKT